MADLIDRQALLEYLEEIFNEHQKRCQRNIGAGFVEVHKEWAAMAMGVAECLDVVRKLPAVDAEPVKHGRWIDAKKRTPNDEERSCAIVGIVNGNNGHINFDNGLIFVRYDTDEGAWWSDDYDIEGCSVDYWLAIPDFNPNCGAKMDLEG